MTYRISGTVLALSTLFLLINALSVEAQVTFVTDRASIGADDLLDWATTAPDGTSLPSPNVLTNNSLSVNVFSGESAINRTTAGSSFPLNFAYGDALIANSNFAPLELTFANPVFGAGAKIDVGNNSGINYTGTIEAFDASGNSLGGGTSTGRDSFVADDSAIFIGVTSTTANIKKVVFTSYFNDPLSGPITDSTLINNLSIRATPEPSSLVFLLSGGAVTAGAFFRRNRRRK